VSQAAIAQTRRISGGNGVEFVLSGHRLAHAVFGGGKDVMVPGTSGEDEFGRERTDAREFLERLQRMADVLCTQ
jgi:hypothetical protein